MGRSFVRQETQLKSSDAYDDTLAASLANMESNALNGEDNFNGLRSMVSLLLDDQAGDWYTDLVTPSALDTGTRRGVNDLNTDLHAVQRKRILRRVLEVGKDVTVGGSDDFVILGTGELPTNTTAAVGSVTTEGTVVADHNAAFGAHSLLEVAGPNALQPDNLVRIRDASTLEPIESGGSEILGLLQSETAADGHTITDATTTRVQISFVIVNGAGDDLIACPAVDIQGKIVNYAHIERQAWEDIPEHAFLGPDFGDAGATAATRQAGYDNQGTTPVDLSTIANLDLAAGIVWRIRDVTETPLFTVSEDSGGGNSQVIVNAATDLYNNDAAVNDFASGATLNSGGTRPVTVGVTDGEIATTAGDMLMRAAGEFFIDDGNSAASTWATDGIKFSEDAAEWSALETAYGEVSIAAMLVAAAVNSDRGVPVYADVTGGKIAANTDIGGVAGGANLTAQLPDMSGGTFVNDYDIYLNGQRLQPGADASANNDVYPGTSLVTGQLKFEMSVSSIGPDPDVICVVPWA